MRLLLVSGRVDFFVSPSKSQFIRLLCTTSGPTGHLTLGDPIISPAPFLYVTTTKCQDAAKCCGFIPTMLTVARKTTGFACSIFGGIKYEEVIFYKQRGLGSRDY